MGVRWALLHSILVKSHPKVFELLFYILHLESSTLLNSLTWKTNWAHISFTGRYLTVKHFIGVWLIGDDL